MKRNGIYYLVTTLLVAFQIMGYQLAKYQNISWNIMYLCSLIVCSVLLGVALTKVVLTFVPKLYKKYVHIIPKEVEPRHRKYYLLATWVLTIAVWSIYILAYYPGILSYDFGTQITQYILREMTTHHPVAHTLLVGYLWELGFLGLDNANIGFLLYSILQMLVLSIVYLRGAHLILKNGCGRVKYILYSLFVALFPLNGFMICTVTKDVLFSAFALLFVICCIELYVQKEEKPSAVTMTLWAVSIVGVCLFRNNGKYALFGAFVGMLWFALKNKADRQKHMKLLLFAVLVFVVSFASMKGIEVANRCTRGSSREMLSVPMQQMARIAVNNHEDMDPELLSYIESSIGTDYVERYRPVIADPIKEKFNTWEAVGDPVKFLKNYFKMFVQYPDDFINAVLTLNAGYLYLNDESCAWINGDYGYIQTEVNEIFLESIGVIVDSKIPAIHQYMENWTSDNLYLKNPLLRILLTPAWYFWVAVYYFAFALQQKDKRHLVIALFFAAYFVTLLLGPAVMVRYIYPIMMSEIFLILWYKKKNE